ncbi:MAG: SDR family oxidoreductase [Chromatiaceae bacterium]|nr:SDR family oxidoreductase [Chromatiaceae bacterium]MCP5442374.1 SDR family oxidoreductase [Chromatiaceae bacterium]
MPENPVAIVTGAYRGLGYETCRQLAQRGYRVILTARRVAEGIDAASALQAEGLEVEFHPLDVTSEASIQQLAEYLRVKESGLEVLVNNAGIFPDPAPDSGQSAAANADMEAIREGFETNTLGPLRLCQLLMPLMKNHGRVVNVSSGMGQLSEMNGCCPGYRLSKTALNAVTRILADEWRTSNVKINSVCPGWVKTEMGGKEAPLTCVEGAAGIVWAAMLPDDGPSGGFFRHGERIDW